MLTIDTLKASEILVDAGFKDAQAKAMVQALMMPVARDGVTKDYLELRFDELDTRLTSFEDRFDLKLAALEQRITVKVGVMIAAALGILLALQKALGL